MSKVQDSIIFQKDIYCECACMCMVRVSVLEFNEDGERFLNVDYIQCHSNGFKYFDRWRSRIKRAVSALRGNDWLPGFEFYDIEATKDFALAVQQAALVVLWGKDILGSTKLSETKE